MTGGRIKIDNYSTKYREDLDPVLNQINLDITSGEKVSLTVCVSCKCTDIKLTISISFSYTPYKLSKSKIIANSL